MSSRGDDAEREGGGPGDDSTARKHGVSQDETAQEDCTTDLQRPLLDSGIRGSSSHAILCTLIVALGSIQSGFTSGYASPTQDCIREDLNLSVPEFSRFGSFSNVGAALGALLSGLIAESRGHRVSLSIASIPNIIGWLLIVHAKDSCFLYIGRLLEGFGVGIIAYTVPVYIAEIAPLNMTGALGSVHQLSVMIGIFLAYLLGMFVQWRLLAAIGCLPCTALLVGLCFIQESPWWLEKRNRTKDSEDSLRVLRGDGTAISDEAAKIKEEVEKSQRTVFQFADLMEKNYRDPLTIGIGLLVLQQLTGINGILYYASTIFKDAGYENSNVATCVLGAIQVVATGFTTWLLDKTGQKKLLLISCGGATVSLFLVTLAFFLKDQCIVPTDSHFYCEQISSLSSAGVVKYFLQSIRTAYAPPALRDRIFSWVGSYSVDHNVQG
ncbi:sugar transporter ERD6-like 4 [Typha latifolia]|uniref:sugar transporter ERD6-like 4 n=1 Tax=Typha latifolia TaxID=4733 RepID=UPI003C2EE0B9